MATSDSAVIHLVDDDEGVREGLAILLAEAGFMVKTYISGVEFLQQYRSTEFGCIVSDIRMPGLDGLEFQQRLKELGISMPLIFITGHGDIQMAVHAMQAGAIDFIEKPFDEDLLLDAVRRGSRGERPDAETSEIQTRLDTLTPRENEVLMCLWLGQLNRATAQELKMSIRTVETHRARIMQKMHARSLSELVRFILRLKWAVV